MRYVSVLGAFSLAFGAAVACASSEEEPTPRRPDDAGSPIYPDVDVDAGSDEQADAGDDSDGALSLCSPDGWCRTSLPDTDLVLKDIWPLSGRAFAIATSPTLGVRVLEWSDTSMSWTYIDDSTQNETGLGAYVGKIWAPSDDEVYYGVSPGFIYHGTRPVPPQTEWSWTRSRLTDHSPTPGVANAGYVRHSNPIFDDFSLGVWGTGPDDVYAWFLNAIFHWESEDGGPPSWVMKHAAGDDPATGQKLYFLGATGTSRDDVWFGGARIGSYNSCALVVNKVGGEYKRVADGVLSPSASTFNAQCVPPPGARAIGLNDGWVGSIHSPAPGVAVVLNSARDAVRVMKDGDDYTIAASSIPLTVMENQERMLSLWAASATEQWLSGKGLVVRVENAWSGGAFEVSTLAVRGAPVRSDLFRIRGTSNTNLWVIGAGYALHKTSP